MIKTCRSFLSDIQVWKVLEELTVNCDVICFSLIARTFNPKKA